MYDEYEYLFNNDDGDDGDDNELFLLGESINKLPSPLYFYEGAYKITALSMVGNTDDISHCTFIIETTPISYPHSPSMITVYEELNKSYLLEFLISVLVKRVLVFNSIEKKINLTKDYACIFITASFSTNQKYIPIDDVILSDSRLTDIITICNTQVMRSSQYFYTLTQPVKYTVVSYDVIKENDFRWDADQIDWYLIYKNYIEEYIIKMMENALRVPIKYISQYTDYMSFNVQFIIDKTDKAFTAEIYLLPNTILDRQIIYNNINSREISISTYSNNDIKHTDIITEDTLRVCLGTQNFSLIPLSLNDIEHTIINGQPFIVVDEINRKYDKPINKYILPTYCHTYINPNMLEYYNGITDAFSCTMRLTVPLFKKSEYDCKENLNKPNAIMSDATITYVDFINPASNKNEPFSIDNMTVYGIVMVTTLDPIPNDAYICTITENLEDPFLPQSLYDTINSRYSNPRNTIYTLLPISAIPYCRQYLVAKINHKSNLNETQSNIINTEETPVVKKRDSFFNRLFKH